MTPGRNPRLGFSLALSTATLWGMLAVALTLLVRRLDPYTVTWVRMAGAGLALGAFQARRRQLPSLRTLNGRGWTIFTVGLLGLLGNYLLFIIALDYVPPATAQLVIQLAPICFLLGGLAVFGERFSRVQWTGLGLLIAGLLLFFNQRLPSLLQLSGDEGKGVAILVVSALSWAAYALAQKRLLADLPSENILLLIYVASALVLLPLANFGSLSSLDGFGWGLLAFGIFNTLAAYGAFAEALDHWEASRVSAVISLTPLLTVAVVYIAITFWPESDLGGRLDALAWLGSLVVVAGSVLAALGKDGAPAPRECAAPE